MMRITIMMRRFRERTRPDVQRKTRPSRALVVGFRRREVAMAAIELDTFPRLLLHHASARGGRPAIREKDLGVWRTWTWREVVAEVRALACGLIELGFRRGDHLAIAGDNRPRLYFAMMAAQALGGVPVPLYQDAVAEEWVFPLHNAEVRFAVV